MVLGFLLVFVFAPTARADTVADAVSYLKQRKPLLVTMESTQGTLQAGQAYWLSYVSYVGHDFRAAFDCQGFSTAWGSYHMARYTNANVDAGQVSCWGMQATIAETGGSLYLSAGGVRVARIAPLGRMGLAFDAAEKFDHDLRDPCGYLSIASSVQDLVDYFENRNPDPACGYSGALYERNRTAATKLEAVARYKPFIVRYSSWLDAETVMATLIAYLRTYALNTSLPFGVASNYSQVPGHCNEPCPYGDYQTSATIIRALYAYGRVSASLVDFTNISRAFMRDVSPRANVDWSKENPNGRMQIMWVIARRYREGLESRTRLDAAHNLLLVPVLWEQMTDSSEWVCGPRRGWGGWIHGLRGDANANCWGAVDVRNMYYKQVMGYHLIIVQGLAESYRLLQRMHLLDAYPFYRDNAPWNLLASAAWVYQLGGQTDTNTGHGGAIFACWNDPSMPCPLLSDGTPDFNGTAPGVQAVYEVLRSFNVPSHMPYYADYPASSSPTWTYAQLQAQTSAGVGYARDIQLDTGSQIYSDALYGQFGSGLGYGMALDGWIF